MKIRKSIIIAALSVILFTVSADALSDSAVVVYDKDSVSYYIVQNGETYAIVKRCSSAKLQEDDELECDLQSLGTKKAYNTTKKENVTVNVEDYGLTRKQAVKKYYELCGI